MGCCDLFSKVLSIGLSRFFRRRGIRSFVRRKRERRFAGGGRFGPCHRVSFTPN